MNAFSTGMVGLQLRTRRPWVSGGRRGAIHPEQQVGNFEIFQLILSRITSSPTQQNTESMSSEIVVETFQPPSPVEAAVADLLAGLSKGWMWSAMALQDIKLRYRGSILGPFWLTLSTLIMVAAMGGIYARLFSMDLARYLPFLAIGLVTWQFISSAINDGCQTFLSSQQIIQQARVPFSVHVWRTVCRNLIVLLHSAVILPIVFIIFPTPIDWHIITTVLALAVLTINAFWIALLLGMISARYRDIPPIVASAVQVIFFVTPIFWPPESLGSWQQLLPINPLFAAMDVVRAPLLGTQPLAYSWTSLMLVTLLGSFCTFVAFVKFRSRIAYWV
jgi:ABC-type polysaccharide/polyol phosphate export permease